MSQSFQQLMSRALQLTRSGGLKGATAAVQAALGRVAAPLAGASAVPKAPAGQAWKVPSTPHDRATIDVPMRPVRPPTKGTAEEAASTSGPSNGGRFIAGSHTESAGTRGYKLYVPSSAAAAPALIVMLHGCKQDPDDFAAGTQMNKAAERQGAFVLYPAQAQGANPARCWNWFKHNHQQRDRGEPAILAGMVRAVIDEHGVDPCRVFVAGLSAGGAMAAILGDAYPDLFAAVGVHSGLPTGAASDVASAFAAMSGSAAGPRPAAAGTGTRAPTIVFHGDQDATVSPVNGERIAADRGGAAPERGPVAGARADGHRSTRHAWRDGGGSVVSEHWVVHGMGHAWSGGSADGSYTDAKGPDATAEMLRFFAANPLRRGR